MRHITNTILSSLLSAGILVLGTASSYAQDNATPPTLTPPKVSKFVDVPRPADTGDEAVSIDLDLTIAADGTLTDAKVVSSGGDTLDRAALEALHRFTFAPARRGDKAVPARVRYRYVFEARAPEAEASSPSAPTFGRMEGQVLLRSNGEAVPGAEVSLRGSDGVEVQHTLTDENGAFRFPDVAPGAYRVHIDALGLASADQNETVSTGELTTLTYRLETAKAAPTTSFGAVASIEAPAREVTKRTLKTEELTRAAGTRGDALRTIELLPGVARPPGLQGIVIIRGSAPTDSQVMFEGAPVDRLYHFGGLTSFTQSRLLERIDLYPGNFSARYGRKLGGIVDVGIRDPKTDGVHGMADVNILDASVLAEGPVGQRGAFAVAAKRSYMDLWFSKVLPKDLARVTAAPVYYDYQAIYTYHPENGDRLRLMAYGSADVFRMALANPADGDPKISGNIGESSSYHRAEVAWRHHYVPGLEHNLSVTGGWFGSNLGLGSIGLDIHGVEAYGRGEWRAQLGSSVQLMAGFDLHTLTADATYNGPRSVQVEGNPEQNGPLSTRELTTFKGTFKTFRPAAYLEGIVRLGEPLTLVVGARADYYSEISAWSFDPRVTARLQLASKTFLKGGVGLFSQPPQYGDALAGLGNPALGVSHAQHFSMGVEQGLGDSASVSLEGFYKRLSDLQVNGLAADGEEATVNGGKGRIYGLEAHAKLQATKRLFGFVSYTLSRSRRNDHGDGWRLFDYDQTHVLTAAGGYHLGSNWDLSTTFRLTSGNPGTPIRGGVYNANGDVYAPVYGGTNSIRDPMFHRLDIRVEKSWKFQAWKLATYLDLQNAYLHKNQEGLQYNYDYSQSQKITGLPFLPSVGMRGEF